MTNPGPAVGDDETADIAPVKAQQCIKKARHERDEDLLKIGLQTQELLDELKSRVDVLRVETQKAQKQEEATKWQRIQDLNKRCAQVEQEMATVTARASAKLAEVDEMIRVGLEAREKEVNAKTEALEAEMKEK